MGGITDYPPHHTTLPHITKDNWRDECEKKRAKLMASIPNEWRLEGDGKKYEGRDNVMDVPKECGILSEKELQITEMDDARELRDQLAAGQLSAVEVTTAFSKRASIAHQLVNCLTETFFDRALKRAKELDEYLKKNGKPVGPLHGVPISLKDQFDIAGLELTMGYAAYLGRVSKEDSCIVTVLEALGAVLYVRTNIPQTLMIGDTFNHVFGRTHNPYNRKLSPGGSSGGEGALIAMKGAILGVGTDIGGSVRIPSAFCGLHTIRPSQRRVPYGKATNSLLGQENVISVAGPMARSMSSVKLFMETVLSALEGTVDASALPFPYRHDAFKAAGSHEKLAFGVGRSDGVTTMTPPLARALEMTIEALKKAGHEVVEFDQAKFKRANDVAAALFVADGGEDISSVLKAIDEPLIPGLIGADADDPKASVHDVHQLNREKEALQQAFLKEWMQTKTSTGRPIDAILNVAVPIPACIPGQNMDVGYTMMFNCLDLPATVFPVTTVQPEIDEWKTKPEPQSSLDSKYFENYKASVSAGVPVTVQVVGRRWQEEALLAVTDRVIEAVNKNRGSSAKY